MIEEQLKNEQVENENNTESDSLVVEEKATEVVEVKGKKKKKKSKARNIIEWVLTGLFAVLFLIAGIGQIDGMINAKKHYNQQIRLGFGSFIVLTDSMEPVYKKNSAIITYNEDADKIYKQFVEYQNFNNAETEKYVAEHPEVLDEEGHIIKTDSGWLEFSKKLKYVDMTFMGVRFADSSFMPDDETLTLPAYPKNAVPVTHRIREIHVKDDVAKGKGKYIFVAAGINEGAELYDGHQFQAFTEKEILGVVKVGSEFLGWFFRVLSSPWGLLIFLLIPALYLVITSTLDIFKAIKEPSEPVTEGTGKTNSAKKIDSLDGLSEADKKRLKEELLEEIMKGKNK